MKGHHPGATWRKADLQCHTARDHSWNGPTQLPGGAAAEEEAREAWADEFIAACIAKGLHVVAITDHHDLCMAEYVQRAAARDGDRVLVYPGVEVTCSDNAQCLTLIEPSAKAELRARFLALKNFTGSDPILGRTAQSYPVGVTIESWFDTVRSDTVLRDNSVLLPHFSDGNAHKHINQQSTHLRFVNLDADGVYIEKPFSELGDEAKRKAYGEVSEWGDRRRAIIPTGDNRFDDWRRLGKHDCWIKLGENTIEALRQALLADEARVSVTRPDVPSERIVSVIFQSTLTGSQPVSMSFNEGFNTIVGGRGSGKSSILEYLRFGIARTVADFPPNEVPGSGGKEQSLIEDTLKVGFVEVVLDRDEVRETWRRKWNTKDHITVTDSAGIVTQLNVSEAQRRFRARAFYQKGLSTTVNNPMTAADQITGIAAAEVLERRRAIEQDIEKAQRSVRNALGQVAAHWQDRLEHRQALDQADDVKQRRQAVTDRLDREGVSADAKAVLSMAPHYSRSRAWLAELQTRITTDRGAIDGFRSRLLETKTDMMIPELEFDEMFELGQAVARTKAIIKGRLDQAIADLAELEAAQLSIRNRFEGRAAAFDAQHQAALAAQSAHASLIDESSRLSTEAESAAAKAAAAAAAMERSSAAVATLQKARNDLGALIQARRALLQEAAHHVAGRSSQRLEALVKRDLAPADYVAALCRTLQSSYVSDPEAKCKDWIEEALRADNEGAWPTISGDILGIYEDKLMAGSPSEPSPEVAARLKNRFFDSNSLTAAQTKRIYGNLNDGTVGDLLSAVPRDFIHLRYIDDQGRKKAFEKASPGQQASALLELLLHQSAGTLLVDQPEDDLDNRVVMKIVDLIRTSKNSRQLIFTTHNPNIVVNGDADKVIVLETNDALAMPLREVPEITLNVDGAIETQSIRAAITRIMEGGKEAFELRRRKYRFDRAV